MLERHFALYYKISSYWDNQWLRYSFKTIFNVAAVRHVEFVKLLYIFC